MSTRADGYTKNGHKLRHRQGLVFDCLSNGWLQWSADQKRFERRALELHLASLQLWAPCRRGEMVATLKAWLAAYQDEELIAQVDSVVEEAIGGLPEPTEGTPPTNPQQGQLN
jgi:hypothetical protein